MPRLLAKGVNAERLEGSLAALSAIGGLESGAVRRLAFTAEDIEARTALCSWMEAASMTVRIDAGGNLIGRYSGLEDDLPVLATGSHIDTVPSGGRYDGALGVMAGLEVIRSLHGRRERLRHPIELIAFADEESTMVGCKSMAGLASADPLAYTTSIGEPIERCLKRIGGNWGRLQEAARSPASLAGFIELHVEQGGVLEARGHAIGVVEGVVGQQRLTISVNGLANHAGTTPMHLRKDAMTAAARVVLAIEALARNHPGDPVATVGKMQVWPNAANIVPGRVDMTVDMRDLSLTVLDAMVADLHLRLTRIAGRTGTRITMTPQFSVKPTPAEPLIRQVIADAAADLGLSHSSLPSRASHDSQEIGRITPMGMIFVPSRGGLSHSCEEFTSPQQCADGAAVLLETLRRLDRQFD